MNAINEIKLEFAHWIGFRAGFDPLGNEAESEFARLKACRSAADLIRFYLATAEPYRNLPPRHAWAMLRREAYRHFSQRWNVGGSPTTLERLRYLFAEGGN